ncbi:MAG TPA: UDP-N-acetylglucosamine 2-epimerase (non-hydrolyzing) [Candidatus Marinimicrobia bacterium]|nr:UDP-N-acetylglucosamine 2-epimerase (non-hydrolyzing) [Candidatus Neomarinimicrobiota bacterium]HRS51460.1 UDP-N-acetylglucosamine 2-epimerase (non-hydrolyzing) [Candidatus Neomarinimicrobiota bacterium]HRU92730.1 UDP-N-acetylglucosamine 2-epimerase (non-hydrolyzing) [Candidatus Neomarinimicrobiota bacterium]
MPTIATIVGARPQFIKCAPVSREIRKYCDEILIHTGQHYDYNMSQAFFAELNIPEPDYNLEIGSGNHGEQTGKMLIELEKALLKIQPDLVLIYGDTNSTMAGALAAAKLQIPIAHVEAGLRSFNRQMPEEINRIVADSLSQYLFAPTQTAVNNLHHEGFTDQIHLVGDVMYDAFLYNSQIAEKSDILERLGVNSQPYYLVTIHRPQNTDDPDTLKALISTLEHLNELIIFPIHPRTRNLMRQFNITAESPELRLVEPVGYLDMLNLEKQAKMIITDSGGVQKEAYFAGVPCLVLRPETEWVELVEHGWAKLIGNDFQRLPEEIEKFTVFHLENATLFGDGTTSMKISAILQKNL